LIGIILAIITAVSGALDLDVLLDKNAERKLRIKSWIKLGLLLLATIFTMRKEYNDGIEKEDTIKAEEMRDSINASHYISDLKNYNLMHSNDLKASDKKNSDSLKSYSANIIKLLANYNLKYDTTTNQIKKAIQNVNGDEPTITAPSDRLPVEYTIDGNKVAFKIRYCNLTTRAANHINLDVYLVIVVSDTLFTSSQKPIFSNVDQTLNGGNCQLMRIDVKLPNFDGDLSRYFLLLTGNYSTNNGKIKPICIAYKFSNELNVYGVHPNCIEVKAMLDKIKKATLDRIERSRK
jgi:hypothetical protein